MRKGVFAVGAAALALALPLAARAAVKTGTAAGETITGTSGPDTLRGRGGDDRLEGLGGPDKLYGETGGDVMDGGTGADLLDGGAGADVATYVSLRAPIVAYHGDYDRGGAPAGSWRVTSAGEVDTLVSVETLVGTSYDDRINGGAGTSDVVRGGGGNDSITGGLYSSAPDVLHGGDGNDGLYGSDEPAGYVGPGDRLHGGNGNDRLCGVDGDDQLFGEAGADSLSGGRGEDLLVGGPGADVFDYRSTGAASDDPCDNFGQDLAADFVRGTDRVRFAAGEDPSTGDTILKGFAGLDSNRNGVLDGADRYVEIRSATYGGVSRTSTVIDLAGFEGYTPPDGRSLTVYGVTGLTAADFVPVP